MNQTVTSRDLPALFQTADQAAIQAQNLSFHALRLALLCGVGGAISSTIGAFQPGKRGFPIVATALLALSLVFTLLLRILNWEKDWYGCRAIAESAKSVAWRFMMGSDPFSKSRSEPDVERELTESLSKIMNTGKPFAARLAGQAGSGCSISDRMWAVRRLGPGERTQIYASQRIADQRKWYSGRAKSNDGAYNFWFVAVLLAQFAALAFAAAVIANDRLPGNLPSLFAAVASALWAWLQAKRFRELAQAYGLAAIELGLIESGAKSADSDEKLAAFVADAENAISREHTMWAARRAG